MVEVRELFEDVVQRSGHEHRHVGLPQDDVQFDHQDTLGLGRELDGLHEKTFSSHGSRRMATNRMPAYHRRMLIFSPVQR